MPQKLRKRHRAHARPLKNLDERFERYAHVIELEPATCRGAWAKRHFPDAREVHLDLGCGKGQFTVAAAAAHPDTLFVGLDYERPCIALAAQKACELELENVVFTLADAEDVRKLFGRDELACIYLNFSTPHPRKKHARERLTYVDELVKYREVLADAGCISLKTDSPPFFEFSLVQFDMAAYDIVWSTRDLRAQAYESFSTEYEDRLVALGAKIHACRAVKAQRDISTEQRAHMSLFDYLPEDLDTLEYVPYGMEGAVFNMRNRRAKQRAKLIAGNR